MYPNLSYFFKDVFGIDVALPIQTYGFFVALAFIIGIWILKIEFKRKEKEGILQSIKRKNLIGEPAKPKELVISGIVGFIVGYKLLDAILNYSTFTDNPQTFILSTSGNFLGGIIGAAISVFFTWREKNKSKLTPPKWIETDIFPHQITGNILMVAAIFGILGAKLFHNLENFDELIADPIGSLFSFSGLTFLGGAIVGSTAVIIYAKRYNIKPLHLLDVAAIGLPLAYAVGRLGCQISGDGCWGVENLHPQPEWLSWLPSWTWSSTYPHNVVNEGGLIDMCTGKHCHALNNPVWPTSLYESTLNVIIFGFLFLIRKRIKVAGMLFSIYLILGGVERFLMELIRVNNLYHIFGFGVTQAEIISVLMIIAGITGIFLTFKYKEKLKSY